MIYTLTLNPSLDYSMKLPRFRVEAINTSNSEDIRPGGKGVNISILLERLGHKSVAMGVVSGFTGEEFVRILKDMVQDVDFTMTVGGNTRINVKFQTDVETEINSMGPADIPFAVYDEIIEKLTSKLKSGDILVLAGSIFPKWPETCHNKLLNAIRGRNITVIIDTNGNSLVDSLRYRPYLIKPNRRELCQIFSKELNSTSEITYHARLLQARGAQRVIVSLGKDGAILLDEHEHIFQSLPPKGHVVNTVGAGDAMLGAYIAAMQEGKPTIECFKYAMAAGSATAYTSWLPTKEEVDALVPKIRLI